MRVLGIDPGINSTGYGIVEETGRKLALVTQGTIKTSSKLSFPERLGKLFQEINNLIGKHQPGALAVEEPFLAQNPRLALHVGQARGVALLAGVNAGIEVTSFTPLEIKQAVVGYGRAEKKQVQEMVKRLLNLGEIPSSDHAADALGAAICHLHTQNFRRFSEKQTLTKKGASQNSFRP